MNAPVKVVPAETGRLDVFGTAERVVAQGQYARFSSQEQLQLCLWVLSCRPATGERYRITILAEPDEALAIEDQAHRLVLARDVASRLLTGAPPFDGIPLLSADLQGAISAVLGTHRRLQNAKPSSVAWLNASVDHRAATLTLETMFQKELSNGE